MDSDQGGDGRAFPRRASSGQRHPLVALVERLGKVEIATLDERHFRAVRPLAGGKAFRLLPGDA
ncbi:MAG: hypothetical protein ACXVHQ_20265 [Solirubrobacteraceae bacterium]